MRWRKTTDVLLAVLILPAPHVLGGLGTVYYTSQDTGTSIGGLFAAYDVAADTWTTLEPYDTAAQMAVSESGDLYAYNYTDRSIELYHPSSDTWTQVLTAPPGSVGSRGNLEITREGEFLYTENWTETLYYTVNRQWFSRPLGFLPNVMGDYDPASNQYVVGEFGNFNAYLVDLNDFSLTSFTTGTGVGDPKRLGVILDNRFYLQSFTGPVQSYDLADNTAPIIDHGIYSNAFYASGTADRVNKLIYMGDGTHQFHAFDAMTGAFTRLANPTPVPNSIVAYVPEPAMGGLVGVAAVCLHRHRRKRGTV